MVIPVPVGRMIWRPGTEKDEERAMPHRDAEAVLSEWYTVQHDLDAALFGTPEARRLHARADRLRDEYQALIDEARELGLAALPPLPVPVEA